MKLKDTIWCWTPKRAKDYALKAENVGKCDVELVIKGDSGRIWRDHTSDNHTSWLGGHCCFGYGKMSTTGKLIFLLRTLITMHVRDGIPMDEIIKNILMKVEETRVFLESDVYSVLKKEPPSDEEYEKLIKYFPSLKPFGIGN